MEVYKIKFKRYDDPTVGSKAKARKPDPPTDGSELKPPHWVETQHK